MWCCVLVQFTQRVGWYEGTSGLTQFIVSIPLAFVIDKFRRDTWLRFSGLLGIVGSGLFKKKKSFQTLGSSPSVTHDMCGLERA
jgi:hypothetical protein